MQVNVLHNLGVTRETRDVVQKLTNEKNSKDTNFEKKINNTEEKESQTITEEQNCMALVPVNTSLTIIGPNFIKKYRNKKIIKLVVVYIISFAIVAFSFSQMYRINQEKSKTLQLVSEVHNFIEEKSVDNVLESENNEENIEKYFIDFEGLKKINSDTKGWIKVNGIGIDFPVVQGTDNQYYLKHSFDKSYNACGWAFVDYRNKLDGTDKNIIIFGHNRRDDTMFSEMTKILEPNWYNNDENRYISFVTEDGGATYEVFSIYQTKVEDFYIQTTFNSNEKYQRFLDTIKSRSTKDYNVDLTTEDKILTLSTCGMENNYRVVLHARKS